MLSFQGFLVINVFFGLPWLLNELKIKDTLDLVLRWDWKLMLSFWGFIIEQTDLGYSKPSRRKQLYFLRCDWEVRCWPWAILNLQNKSHHLRHDPVLWCDWDVDIQSPLLMMLHFLNMICTLIHKYNWVQGYLYNVTLTFGFWRVNLC